MPKTLKREHVILLRLMSLWDLICINMVRKLNVDDNKIMSIWYSFKIVLIIPIKQPMWSNNHIPSFHYDAANTKLVKLILPL